jgi:hypothetical protein
MIVSDSKQVNLNQMGKTKDEFGREKDKFQKSDLILAVIF